MRLSERAEADAVNGKIVTNRLMLELKFVINCYYFTFFS